jgi:hypothetical protein
MNQPWLTAAPGAVQKIPAPRTQQPRPHWLDWPGARDVHSGLLQSRADAGLIRAQRTAALQDDDRMLVLVPKLANPTGFRSRSLRRSGRICRRHCSPRANVVCHDCSGTSSYVTPGRPASSLSTVIGKSRTRTPVALNTALATAAPVPQIPNSPIPFMPKWLACSS